MRELVVLFVSELPNRVDALTTAWDERDADALVRLTHQMKGAAPGYGFDVLGHAAARIEDRLRTADAPDAELEKVKQDVDALVDLCRRAILPDAA
ncbi:MAG: Hpt domain-containing protein [Planctomycetota bacterium]